MNIESLLMSLRSRQDCLLYQPCGFPEIKATLTLPTDVVAFYTLCGGGVLFHGQMWPVSLCSPSECIHANTSILDEEREDDISNSWYIIAGGKRG